MINKYTSLYILLSLFGINCSPSLDAGREVILEKGLSYRYLEIREPLYKTQSTFNIFYVELDPKLFSIKLLLAQDINDTKSLDIKEYSKLFNCFIAINASFFDKEYNTLGLQIQNGLIIKRLRKTNSGVFYIQDNEAHIKHSNELSRLKDITLAIQSTPILIYNGRISKLKKQKAKRSFIAITKDKKVILGTTINSEAYIDELASILALNKNKGGIDSYNALNLDGGSSSQFIIKHKSINIHIKGDVTVPNALGIQKKHLPSSKTY